MLIDAHGQLSSRLFQPDVCIIGGGPAGLTIARELSRARISVCVLESGGKQHEATPQTWNGGQVDSPHGYRSQTLQEGRSRQMGGSAGLWNHLWRGHSGRWVRYIPLDAIDFERRNWVPESGWPFPRDELMPYYERARKVCGVGPIDRGDTGARNTGKLILWETPSLEPAVAQFGQGNPFLRELPATLSADEHATVILHAVLKGLRLDDSRERIEAADVTTASGGDFRVEAQVFIVAAGGLENARILLQHDAIRRGGLGNAHGMVGRCFMDHPAVTLGQLRPFSNALFENAGFYDQHSVDGQTVMGSLHIRPEALRREQILNFNVSVAPQLKNFRSNLAPIIDQLFSKGPRFLWQRGLRLPAGPPQDGTSQAPTLWRRMLEGYYSECFCGWSELRRKQERFSGFRVRCSVEQSADRSNRIYLDDAVDQFGQRKIRVAWIWNEPELRTLRKAQEILSHELAATGIGEFTPAKESTSGSPFEFFSPHHFMGTTRMHVSPVNGVVDADCRVHGVQNLFVAGSSLFPTAGFANPTLTVIALALRLAGHVRGGLREELPSFVSVDETANEPREKTPTG